MPQAALSARGSRLAKLRPGEPQPDTAIPKKPEWLGPIASDKWDEVVPALVELGVMAVVYGDFIAMYCQAHQDLHDAMQILNQSGMTCLSEKGGEYLHPAVSIKQNAIDRIARFGKEFGMSPSAVRDVTKTPGSDKKTSLANAARKR